MFCRTVGPLDKRAHGGVPQFSAPHIRDSSECIHIWLPCRFSQESIEAYICVLERKNKHGKTMRKFSDAQILSKDKFCFSNCEIFDCGRCQGSPDSGKSLSVDSLLYWVFCTSFPITKKSSHLFG